MADVFTVYAFDPCTNTPVCVMPANALTFDKRLNDSGSIGFTCNLVDPEAAEQVRPFVAYAGQPVALYVDRDGRLVWGGWSKTWHYQHSTKQLQVSGKEWPDYFSARRVARDYTIVQYPGGVAPADLVRTAVTEVQALDPAGNVNVGVRLGDGFEYVVPFVTPNYTAAQSTVAQLIADVTQGTTPGTGGVDVWLDAQWTSGGGPAATLVVESPRAGRDVLDSNLGLDLLRAIEFSWPADVQQSGTHFRITGAGSGQAQLVVDAVTDNVPVGGLGGMPRMDKGIQHSTVTNPAFLRQLADGDAFELGGPVTVPTVTVPTAHPSNPLGSRIGDDWRLYAAPFELFAGGIDQDWRCVAWSCQVPDDGVPTWTGTFNPPPI